jgi:hypothetical protein
MFPTLTSDGIAACLKQRAFNSSQTPAIPAEARTFETVGNKTPSFVMARFRRATDDRLMELA